jgi:hypothetical protein
MPAPSHPPHPPLGEEVRPEDLGHPRGTLAILIIFGLAFGLAWFAMYFFQFLGRGAPHSS